MIEKVNYGALSQNALGKIKTLIKWDGKKSLEESIYNDINMYLALEGLDRTADRLESDVLAATRSALQRILTGN